MTPTWQAQVKAIHETVVKAYPVWSPEDRRFLALALAGEVGELLNWVKKEWRGDIDDEIKLVLFAEQLIAEFADVRIYLELLAMANGVDLDEAVKAKIPELLKRWPESRRAVEALS